MRARKRVSSDRRVGQRQQPSARTRHAHEHCVTIKRRSNRNRGCYRVVEWLDDIAYSIEKTNCHERISHVIFRRSTLAVVN
jgi:hypothetical protein